MLSECSQHAVRIRSESGQHCRQPPVSIPSAFCQHPVSIPLALAQIFSISGKVTREKNETNFIDLKTSCIKQIFEIFIQKWLISIWKNLESIIFTVPFWIITAFFRKNTIFVNLYFPHFFSISTVTLFLRYISLFSFNQVQTKGPPPPRRLTLHWVWINAPVTRWEEDEIKKIKNSKQKKTWTNLWVSSKKKAVSPTFFSSSSSSSRARTTIIVFKIQVARKICSSLHRLKKVKEYNYRRARHEKGTVEDLNIERARACIMKFSPFIFEWN